MSRHTYARGSHGAALRIASTLVAAHTHTHTHTLSTETTFTLNTVTHYY